MLHAVVERPSRGSDTRACQPTAKHARAPLDNKLDSFSESVLSRYQQPQNIRSGGLENSDYARSRAPAVIGCTVWLTNMAQERHGGDSRLPPHTTPAAWLPHAHVVVPLNEASAGKSSGLRARVGGHLSKSVGDQRTHATSKHTRMTALVTTGSRDHARLPAHTTYLMADART